MENKFESRKLPLPCHMPVTLRATVAVTLYVFVKYSNFECE